jgi:putative FmdB family regulatory protein
MMQVATLSKFLIVGFSRACIFDLNRLFPWMESISVNSPLFDGFAADGYNVLGFSEKEACLPLYEYQCKKCGKRMEKIRKFSDPPLTVCESCGGKLEQLLSSPAIQFKGSGWYVTDYAKKSPASSSGSSDDSSSSSEKKEKAEAKADAKSDAKSEGKSEAKESSNKPSEPAKVSTSKE